jgi:demethylmenaquinone methyltransferase/2-methoxy-6-polyprenyl-1,4-benzoquinol methylase
VKLADAFDSPERKQRYVRRLFATIADRYDFITVVLSFGRDRAWKRRLVREAGIHAGERVFDLATGTGDIAFEAARAGADVVGLDVTPRMIALATAKTTSPSVQALRSLPRFIVGDMMALPFADASADVVTTGYGLRNVPQLECALGEIRRVLKPRGRLLSLDFNRPSSAIIRVAYLGYLGVVGAALGSLLHGDPDTYRYIPESLRRYPGASGISELMRRHGFDVVRVVPIFGGFMSLHVATQGVTERHPRTETRADSSRITGGAEDLRDGNSSGPSRVAD